MDLEIFRKTCQQLILAFKGEEKEIISTRVLPVIFQSRSLCFIFLCKNTAARKCFKHHLNSDLEPSFQINFLNATRNGCSSAPSCPVSPLSPTTQLQ